MTRLFLMLSMVLALAACSEHKALNQPTKDLGAFKLGHNIVVAPKMQKVPISREATKEEWIEALTTAIGDRFSRYDGDQLYHFGVSVEGFALAPPGVPLVFSPKSALVINVTVWDDAAGKKLNEEPEQLVVFEDLGNAPIVGSGYVNTREEQLAALSFNAAHRIERWMVEMREEKGWFEPRGETEEAPQTPQPEKAAETKPEPAKAEPAVPENVAPQAANPADLPPASVPQPAEG